MYYIPQNYKNSSKLLGGMFETRNAVEAGFLCAIVAFLDYLILGIFSPGTYVQIAVYMLTTIPLFIVALVGIDGDSLTQRLMMMRKFWIRKRVMRYKRFR